jgi:hypothetical protein
MNHADLYNQLSGSFDGEPAIPYYCPLGAWNRITFVMHTEIVTDKYSISIIFICEGCRRWTKNISFICDSEWLFRLFNPICTFFAIQYPCGLPVDRFGYPEATKLPEHTFVQSSCSIINSKRLDPKGRRPSYRSCIQYCCLYKAFASFMRSSAFSGDKLVSRNGRPM